MAKKKKLTKAERKEARLRKGKQWLLTYTGSPGTGKQAACQRHGERRAQLLR